MPPTAAPTTSDSVLLRELRERFEVSQQQLADALGTSQPAVLKAERATDPQLSTLQRYVAALGAVTGVPAALEVAAVIDGERFPLTPTKGPIMNTETMTRTTDTASPTVWRLRAWDDAVLEERFMRESLISISADEIGDVTAWPGDDEMRRRLREGTRTLGQDRGEQAIGMFVRYWDDFRNQMKPGDVVVVPLLGRRAAIGVITGDYAYCAAEDEPKMRHVRSVRWLRTIERSALDDRIRKVVNAPGTICRINAPGAADWLLG